MMDVMKEAGRKGLKDKKGIWMKEMRGKGEQRE